jgi:Uma2 family endonuclease
MIAKARPKAEPSRPKYTFGPMDHGRAITDAQAENARWVEGFRYEIIDGRIYVSPMAELWHEDLASWIAGALRRYSRKHPEVINQIRSPARVFVPDALQTTVPEPDVAAYRDFPLHLQIGERHWQDISPLLVAEIVSGDVAKDLTRNVVLYEQVPSIQEYWVVNYWTDVELFFRVFRRRGKSWGKPIDWKLGETYTTRVSHSS